MKTNNLTKFLPLVLVVIALIFSISYFHESEVTEVRDEVQSGLAAPQQNTEAANSDYRSEIPL